MKFDMTTFGEAMIRLSMPQGENIANCAKMDFHTGGSEANVAVALSQLGMKTAWLSRLTDNALGRRIERDIAGHGVDTSAVNWTSNDRVGLYYVEFASSPRPASVIYDRLGSAFSKISPGQINWKILLNTRLLHLTGITPALSPNCRRVMTEAVKRAWAKRIPVSFDVNYRAKLWKPGAAARTLSSLLDGATITIMTREDAESVFRIRGDPESALRAIRDRFHVGIAVLTLGADGAMAWDGADLLREPGHQMSEVIDRIGAGDAFAAGFIHGYLCNDIARGLKIGIAMSALKMGIRGDYFKGNLSDIKRVIKSRKIRTRAPTAL